MEFCATAKSSNTLALHLIWKNCIFTDIILDRNINLCFKDIRFSAAAKSHVRSTQIPVFLTGLTPPWHKSEQPGDT